MLYQFGHKITWVPYWHIMVHTVLCVTIVAIRQFEPYISKIDSSFEVFVCLALTCCMHIGSVYEDTEELDMFFNVGVTTVRAGLHSVLRLRAVRCQPMPATDTHRLVRRWCCSPSPGWPS
jgi:hypothetical protein